MARVILLGAGASFGADLSKPPPMLSNFFSEGVPQARADYSRLWGVLGSLGMPYVDLVKGAWNLEQVFSELDGWELWAKGKKLREVRAEVGDSVGLLAPTVLLTYFILDVLYESSAEALKNPCSDHCELFRRLNEDDTVVTFNYDLVAEGALAAARDWSPVRGYGIQTGPDAVDHTTDEWASSILSTRVRLLKAHGSTNWKLENNDIQVQAPESVSVKEVLRQIRGCEEMIELNDEHLEDWDRYQDVFWRRPVVIVPPTFDKFGGDVPASLLKIWEQIEVAIQKATSILAVGFSFAPADLHFAGLFRAQVRRNAHRKIRVGIINPDPTVRSLVEQMSPKLEVAHLSDTLGAYLKSGQEF